ncbi:electron transfer flavoprotein subunit beta/FixA family protein [Plebeiibacterium sediminum]|uniref:Electron transfer flavoprotein subunit beta/FixA family protein n=1 Tax=Plebeiibacterium sediminum TaxID=2992112 RepID=A0AAE3SGK6_9BACT|nr:electron transfer flavoprotein subunit beta/FixA family protein [Plebeiobacterium sediminum]MCW3788595.1 electron transfer flavoprotein subunit beta/FixA family protein [Plebeiobacterium sediminum]
MGLKIIVLAKQVPDTRNVGKDAMKADGTVNRAALPAIFNPEDLNALEQALRLKDRYPDTEITILTMGPGRAADIIREGLYRGADKGFLLTDRAFAGSDTLATSYAISCAIKKIKDFDIIIAGRQAIDGDTAQVGPQVAEKLNLPQVTYAEEIISVNEGIVAEDDKYGVPHAKLAEELDLQIKGSIRVKRRLERGVELIETTFPCVLTVNASAPDCRPRNAKKVMKYKHAKTVTEIQEQSEDYINIIEDRPYLKIEEWSVNDIETDHKWLGLTGSPTKVKKIENVVFQAKESKRISSDELELEQLIVELIENHTIG